MSRATRAAIWSRLKRCIVRSFTAPMVSSGNDAAWGLHDPLDEDAGRHDRLGIQYTEPNDFAHLRDRAFRRARHDRPEVARGLAVDEIAPAVGTIGLDQRVIRTDRIFEHVATPVDLARLLPLRKQRAVAGRREEAADADARCHDALGEVALRHQLELDLARAVQRVEHPR